MYRVRNIADVRFVVRIAGYHEFLNRGYSLHKLSQIGKRIRSPGATPISGSDSATRATES